VNSETDDQPLHHDATLTPVQPIPPVPSTLHRIFIGKDGLRAGWSLLIFIALFAALIFSVNAIGRKLYPPAPNAVNATTEISPQRAFIFESIPLLIALLLTWIMSKIERRPNSVYGLGGRRKLPRFFAGLASGIICLSILILVLVKTGFLIIDRRLLFGGNILRYGTIWLLGFLLVGLRNFSTLFRIVLRRIRLDWRHANNHILNGLPPSA
jgi:hypothetical protein